MRSNTLVMIGLAVAFGVMAVFLSNFWLNGRQPEAAVVTANVHAEDMVVVAATPLRFGDRLTLDNLREIPWTAGALPAGAFHTRAALLDAKLGDRQVLTAIGANEPIMDWKITGPGQRATLSAVLTEGMKAISIRVNDVQGVAGFVLPGDRVDVMLSRTQDNQAFVDVLLQNIKVLAIDQTADDKKENPTVAKSVTVEVSTLDAQKLTLAAGVGQLSLALREVAANADEATQRVSLSDLGGATIAAPAPTPASATPSAPAATMATMPTHATVDVYRGTQMQTYEVPLTN
jgi:pilus assembly protein CpaB